MSHNVNLIIIPGQKNCAGEDFEGDALRTPGRAAARPDSVVHQASLPHLYTIACSMSNMQGVSRVYLISYGKGTNKTCCIYHAASHITSSVLNRERRSSYYSSNCISTDRCGPQLRNSYYARGSTLILSPQLRTGCNETEIDVGNSQAYCCMIAGVVVGYGKTR